MKVQSVNIVMTYPVHWTKYQVLRDFTQNFYDAVDHNLWRQSFYYEYRIYQLFQLEIWSYRK